MSFFKKSMSIDELINLTFALFENRLQNISKYLHEENIKFNNNLLFITTFFINIQIIKSLLNLVYKKNLINTYSNEVEKKFFEIYIKSDLDDIITYTLYLKDDLDKLLNDFSNSDLEKLANYFLNEVIEQDYSNSLTLTFETILVSWKSKSKFIINDYKIKH